MIIYRCDHCGDRITEWLRVTLTCANSRDEHFCSIDCAITWAQWAGYYTPPPDGVVDAAIYCGAKSPTKRDCKFTDAHPGDHVSHAVEVWTDADDR